MLVVFSCDTANNVDPLYKEYFIKTYGRDGNQVGVDILLNNDNTLTLLGRTTLATGEKRIYFIKTDLTGKVLVEKEIGGDTEIPVDIEPINGGYIVLSNIQLPSAEFGIKTDVKLTRITSDGDVIDFVIFDGFGDQYGRSVTAISDGRFFVIGNTRDTDETLNSKLVGITDQEDALILEFDNTLTPLDSFRIGSSSIGMGIKIFENLNGTLTYGGFSDELREGDTYNSNFIFRTFSSNPSSVPTLIVGDNLANERMSAFIKATTNNTFFGIGTEAGASGSSRLFVSHVSNGSGLPVKLYETSIGNTKLEGIAGCMAVNKGTLYVVANEFDIIDNTRDIKLYALDSFTGLEKWSKTYGSEGNDDESGAVIALPDGSIVILGTVTLINQQKLALIKVNARGEFSP
jgi:outer membrane protein assembly factor BamB